MGELFYNLIMDDWLVAEEYDEEIEQISYYERDLNKLRANQMKEGFRDGYEEGHDSRLQEGFNSGFINSACNGFSVTTLNCILNLLSQEDLTSDQQNRVRSLLDQLSLRRSELQSEWIVEDENNTDSGCGGNRACKSSEEKKDDDSCSKSNCGSGNCCKSGDK